jgi:long-chain acyl-CoA synthetase
MTPDIMKFIAAGFSNFLPIPGRTMLCGPFYHSAQWAFSFFPMIGGSTTVMQHKYDSAAMLQMIDRYSCTNVHLVPTQMKRLLDLPAEVKNEFSGASLTTVWHGAAPCPPAVKRGLIDWWGPKITEYYGSTEGSIISTVSSTEWLAKGGSVGKPLDSVEVIVVNDESERVAQGQEGTLYFKNKMGTDFSYHNDEAKTRDSHLEPGVFTTGDVGYIDSDGYLWLSDRKIDMIISGGVNIYPAEIEGVIAAHPAVEDVAVIGVPDEEFGESVKALVQVTEGTTASSEVAQAIIAHCRELLAGYKAPRSVDFVQHIPRTGTGKIQKQPLRAPYWEGHQRRI